MMRALAVLLTLAVTIAALFATDAEAADLHPQTVAAFDRYVRLTEDRLRSGEFLWIDGLSDPRRQQARAQVHENELVIERLTTTDGRKDDDRSGVDAPSELRPPPADLRSDGCRIETPRA
jgi:hypothetical protein